LEVTFKLPEGQGRKEGCRKGREEGREGERGAG